MGLFSAPKHRITARTTPANRLIRVGTGMTKSGKPVKVYRHGRTGLFGSTTRTTGRAER